MDELTEYIEGFLSYPNPVLGEIEAQHGEREDSQPNIGIQVGAVLSFLVHAIQATDVLEFGTCLGYSTVFLGEALHETGGKLIAIESNEALFKATEENVERAGLSHVVELIHGDAAEVLDELDGPFDLILQDSKKALYPIMLEKCIAKCRPNGVIAADDALFKPMGAHKELSDALHEYNQMVFSDSRLVSTILPIGDGLTLSVRK